MKRVRKYINNQSGNVAIMFAIIVVPLLIAIGVAVDYSRLSASYSKLQNAADSAALAAAISYMENGSSEMKKIGRETFKLNSATVQDVTLSNIKVKKTNANTIQITSDARLKPMFMHMFGYSKLDYSLTSEATLTAYKGMEISIAFDSTNSMNFDSRWDSAMSAINNTLKDMKRLSGKKDFYVSLVPFSDRVNVGTANDNWLDGPEPINWEGCVEPREEVKGKFNWSVDDDSPRVEPFTASIPGTTGIWPGSLTCPSVEITGPTKKPNEIIRATKAMTHGGTGRFDSGMVWAWRLLSPKWKGEWGVPNYPADHSDDRKKKLIFVSDGNSEAYSYEMSQESTWGFNKGSMVAFEHLVELCSNIKNDGIEIYMLKIDGNTNADTYFEQCASSPSHFYRVREASDITLAFADIVDELYADLRLVK